MILCALYVSLSLVTNVGGLHKWMQAANTRSMMTATGKCTLDLNFDEGSGNDLCMTNRFSHSIQINRYSIINACLIGTHVCTYTCVCIHTLSLTHIQSTLSHDRYTHHSHIYIHVCVWACLAYWYRIVPELMNKTCNSSCVYFVYCSRTSRYTFIWMHAEML